MQFEKQNIIKKYNNKKLNLEIILTQDLEDDRYYNTYINNKLVHSGMFEVYASEENIINQVINNYIQDVIELEELNYNN